MPAGRPPMFETKEDMQPCIDAYFSECEERERPATVAGLAYALGFSDRHSISEYANKEEFTATIKRAKLRIEMDRSETLVTGKGNIAGVIFDLKNNYDWKDQQDHKHSGSFSVVVPDDDAGTL